MFLCQLDMAEKDVDSSDSFFPKEWLGKMWILLLNILSSINQMMLQEISILHTCVIPILYVMEQPTHRGLWIFLKDIRLANVWTWNIFAKGRFLLTVQIS